MRLVVAAISIGLVWLIMSATGVKLPSLGGGSGSAPANAGPSNISIEGSLPCQVSDYTHLTPERLPTCVEAKKYAKGRLIQKGQGNEWNCLDQLWDHEANWSAWAVGPPTTKGTAKGISQALGHGDVFALGDWKAQVDWGLDYIWGRPDYGGPCNAWQLWQSRVPHWY
jgi:hypothetical protein